MGLRERKKLDTKRQIVQVANKQFRKYGYDAVTLEQIAATCVMSVRTILRYFSTKEALALAAEHELLDDFRNRLETRQTDAVSCWREFHEETVHLMETPIARQRMIAIFSTPPLLAEFLRIGQAYEDALAGGILEESEDGQPLQTAVFASILVSSATAAFRRWLTSDEAFDMVVLGEIVDRVCEAFDHRRQAKPQKPRRKRATAS
ncbi:MAG: TetR/AcrR family transcriptional regulator [Mycobacterium sp.]|nr:TetR/AcrR family transcriptional regulator [Mycobacterium sp.]